MASIRILFHRSHLNPRAELFAEALVAEGHEVTALCWDRKGSSNAANDAVPCTRVSSPGLRVSMLNAFLVPILYLQFVRELHGNETDVLFCGHVSLLPLAAVLGLSGTTVVYDVVDPRVEDYSERDSMLAPLFSWTVKAIEHACLTVVDGITVIDTSGDVVKERYEGFTDNLAVVYNVPKLKPPHDRVGTHDTIVYVGVLDDRKGVSALLEAFALVRQSQPDVELLFIGDSVDDTANRLRSRAAELGVRDAVEFAGRVDYAKVHESLGRGDVAAAPYQPVPMNRIVRWNARKIPDYMNAALPVVVPDFGGFPEIVETTECGVTVDTTDIEELRDALGALLDDADQARHLGTNGRRAVAERYNWENEQSKVVDVIETALGD
ncbi:glycosyltransferase family 4 protein [Haloarcula salina]|uniref:glycosyltransferase family 4 protein n=1 Tax=Haloarcula salina TaxID=1429914 RepID=UPI003C6FF229